MKNARWLAAGAIGMTLLSKGDVIDATRHHLRSGTAAEWQEFASKTPQGKRLDLRFEAKRNATDATLLIQQDNVKLDWRVEVNGTRVGNLFLMEEPLVWAMTVPAGTLRAGVNTLSIIPPKENDDIVVGPFQLETQPLDKVLGDATVQVEVSDAESGAPLPCRITVTDLAGVLAPLRNAGGTTLALRPGVAYSCNGQARLGLIPGDYDFYASRGFEYSVGTQQVLVTKGSMDRVSLKIRREVQTPGLVTSDTHIHTFTHAKHGDATVDERMLTLAGEGIELPISTEHNMLVDFVEPAKRLGVANYFTPVIGCEVTTKAGHFNVFPVQAGSEVPDSRLTDWRQLMKSIRSTPGVQIAILNHPQDVHSGFVPFASTNLNGVTGENLRGFEFTFDAVELINSGALRSDLMEVYRNWFSLLNYGYRIAGVGASDSHDVSRFIVGQGRTYVACKDSDVGQLDVAEAVRNMREGHSYVSLGLLPRIQVEDRFGPGDLVTVSRDKIKIEVTVLGPSWVTADKLEIFQNGISVAERSLQQSELPEKAKVSFELPRPAFDVHIVAVASGPGVRSPHWAIPRPYQPGSPVWNPRVLGSSNPVWIDSDGDGKFTSARVYARSLVAKHGRNLRELLESLKIYDRAVAAQAASLIRASGIDLTRSDTRELVMNAGPSVKEGFLSYIESLQ
jgi:hypothetical protein